jgi:FixJ family two-component response regulator
MGDTTICVVDDDPSVRRAISRLIGSYGFAVETFASAEAFLGASKADRCACLILDVHMAGMSGIDLHDYLTAEGCDPPPVIFITAQDDQVARSRVGRNGAVAYILKPFDSGALLAAVRHAIGRDLERPSA